MDLQEFNQYLGKKAEQEQEPQDCVSEVITSKQEIDYENDSDIDESKTGLEKWKENATSIDYKNNAKKGIETRKKHNLDPNRKSIVRAIKKEMAAKYLVAGTNKYMTGAEYVVSKMMERISDPDTSVHDILEITRFLEKSMGEEPTQKKEVKVNNTYEMTIKSLGIDKNEGEY